MPSAFQHLMTDPLHAASAEIRAPLTLAKLEKTRRVRRRALRTPAIIKPASLFKPPLPPTASAI